MAAIRDGPVTQAALCQQRLDGFAGLIGQFLHSRVGACSSAPRGLCILRFLRLRPGPAWLARNQANRCRPSFNLRAGLPTACAPRWRLPFRLRAGLPAVCAPHRRLPFRLLAGLPAACAPSGCLPFRLRAGLPTACAPCGHLPFRLRTGLPAVCAFRGRLPFRLRAGLPAACAPIRLRITRPLRI